MPRTGLAAKGQGARDPHKFPARDLFLGRPLVVIVDVVVVFFFAIVIVLSVVMFACLSLSCFVVLVTFVAVAI